MAYGAYQWTDGDGDTLRMTLHENGDVVIGITDQFGACGPLHMVDIDELLYGIEKMRQQLRIEFEAERAQKQAEADARTVEQRHYDPDSGFQQAVPEGGFDG